MSLQTDNDRLIASIRANIVFERMIVSVLTVAVLAGVARLFIGVVPRAFSTGLTFSAAGTALFEAVGYAFMVFLAGFAAALAVGIPLFRALEKAKVRKTWPFALAAFAVSLAILAAAGLAPSFEAPARALHLVPGVAAALLFGRRMRSLWVAADRSDAAAPVIVRPRQAL